MPSVPTQVPTPKTCARCAAPPKATVNRRQAFAMVAGLVALAAPKAEAVTNPAQESTGGQAKRGSVPPSSSEASSSGYNMEGTKKMGVSSKRRQQVLAQARAQAGK
eukprot:GFKZ01014877.1.p1 GENE.GFKZ01014877.1~~GFKZ01014877.1.p1  ORF type:complete len:106 (-),score=7.52 GFKZ01014877.1:76-393(-)